MILPIAEFYPRLIPHPRMQIALSIILIPLSVVIIPVLMLSIVQEMLSRTPTKTDME